LIGTFVFGLILSNVHQVSALLEYQTPLELYTKHELIVIGKVISLTETSKVETLYNIKVEQYLKNPKPYDLIDAYGTGTNNGGIWIEDGTVFEIGDRVLLYLFKEGGKYRISPYSFIAPKSCEKHQLLQLAIIPGEPKGFDPSSGPIYLSSVNQNEARIVISSTGDLVLKGEEIAIKYDAWNNHRSYMDFDVEMYISWEDQIVPLFHDKHSLYDLEPCTGQFTESWNFIPEKTGKYNVMVIFDGITTSYDFEARENLSGISLDKTPYPSFDSSPLRQVKSEIAAEDIVCKKGFVLMTKPEKDSPVCVKPTTAIKLVERNWNIVLNQFFAKSLVFNEVLQFKNDTKPYDTVKINLAFLQYTTTTNEIPHFLFYTLDENMRIKYKEDIVIRDYSLNYLPPEQIAQFVWFVDAVSDLRSQSILGIVDAKTGSIIGVTEITTFKD